MLDVDEIISITINKMREDFRSSKNKRYLMYPKSCALFEHEYDMDLPDVDGRDKLSQKWSFKIEPPGNGIEFNDT